MKLILTGIPGNGNSRHSLKCICIYFVCVYMFLYVFPYVFVYVFYVYVYLCMYFHMYFLLYLYLGLMFLASLPGLRGSVGNAGGGNKQLMGTYWALPR